MSLEHRLTKLEDRFSTRGDKLIDWSMSSVFFKGWNVDELGGVIAYLRARRIDGVSEDEARSLIPEGLRESVLRKLADVERAIATEWGT